jgi:hypothetical protein
MIGSATVPITYQEFQKLFDQPHPVLYYSGLTMDWFTTLKRNPAVTEQTFDKMQVRILNQDYRHYFGEVVDLASKVNDTYLEYLNHGFFLYFNEKRSYILDRNDNWLEFSGNITECKQWLADYFTVIAAKDLPHTNIKFIFS